MKASTLKLLTAIATIVGVLSLLLFTTLVKDIFFKDVNYCVSNFGDLSLKTTALLCVGCIVGFISSLIVVRNNVWPHILISSGVFLQLFYASGCPLNPDPVWFDLMQNLLLVSGIWLGSYAALKFPLAPV